MSDYFGYDVTYVMNVTDVDDKIIRRARHQHLLSQYANNTGQLKQMVDDCSEALKARGWGEGGAEGNRKGKQKVKTRRIKTGCVVDAPNDLSMKICDFVFFLTQSITEV